MRKLYLFILSVFFFSSGAFALILEDLPQAKLYELLSGKKLAIILDPLIPFTKVTNNLRQSYLAKI